MAKLLDDWIVEKNVNKKHPTKNKKGKIDEWSNG